MSTRAAESVGRYRRRAQQKGLVRVEVQVPREDVDAVRAIIGALRSPNQDLSRRTREELLELARKVSGKNPLKALLESAPLEGVDLTRSRDPGRPIDLG